MSNHRHGHGSMQAGQSATYRSWAAMKRRCSNPAADNYCFYGAKGITYDPRWEDFSAFLADMGERPEGTTLDRWPDKTGNYGPDNCRWATHREQIANSKTQKLTDEDVANILDAWKDYTGRSGRAFAREIAPEYDVAENTIRAIISPTRGYRGAPSAPRS